MIRRFSSRTARLDQTFLRDRLQGAHRYLRIAGYFRSSLLELVREEISAVGEVRIVCNSDLDPKDIATARSAAQRTHALKESWYMGDAEAEVTFSRRRYQDLYDLLRTGRVEVRVVGRTETAFLHGKAGVIEAADGRRTAFMGSANETREAWTENYEIVWEDDSDEAVRWVTEEFDHLWALGVPLPDAMIEEIGRCAARVEYPELDACPPENLAAATMAEAPLHRRGESLMPWQQSFAAMFMEHRRLYGKARLLLADEVGVGKTLSLAACAALGCLSGDGPTLILCPANLTLQWQVELWDKLGIPSAVWTSRKEWLDHTGHAMKTRGPEDVARCPYQVGIVSTGLLVQATAEREALLRRRFGTLIVDEAHRARVRRSITGDDLGPNRLLDFLRHAAESAGNVLLATATPIQTSPTDLWDLLDVLARGAPHVLGDEYSRWRRPDEAIPFITGERVPGSVEEAWGLVRNPLPPRSERDPLFDLVRSELAIADDRHVVARGLDRARVEIWEAIEQKVCDPQPDETFLQRYNPVVRFVVLRRRAFLEERGLLPRVGVRLHPMAETAPAIFDGDELRTSASLEEAFDVTRQFVAAYSRRSPSAGLLEGLLLQRICSSVESGLQTVRRLLREDDVGSPLTLLPGGPRFEPAERVLLQQAEVILSAERTDPKFAAVVHYLTAAAQPWIDLGCIVFSQYLDTASWVAASLAERLRDLPIALYAGPDRSGIHHDGRWTSTSREAIKAAVRQGRVRLVIATDAACEGLNLQTLGTLINIDLPWNPSRLEQRLGRIRRIGQAREFVDLLNLRYAAVRDQAVFARVSDRMKDRYDVLGSLPDTLEDDWTEEIAADERRLSQFIERRAGVNSFDRRYGPSAVRVDRSWETCSQVLSRRDIVAALSRNW